MKRIVTALVSALVLVSLTSLPAASAARIVSITFCEQVSEDGTVPINVMNRFGGDAPSIHAVIAIEKAKKGSTIKGAWISVDAIETPNYEIDAAEATAPSGDAVVHFALSRPNNGWPQGKYKLDVYIDGEFAVSAPFSVAHATGDESAAQGKGTVSKKSTDQKAKSPEKKDTRAGLLGTWQCQMQGGTSTLVLESDSRLNLDGQPASYRVVANALRVQDENGTQDYPFKLDNNVLTISFAEGYEMQFTRISDTAEYRPEDYPPGTDTEPGVYGEGQTAGEIPAGGRAGGQTPSGGDQDLMNHFAGTWWNATTNTETNVTLTADGRYFESYAAGYSGGSSDQYGNSDMSWGAAGDQTAQGTWTVRGTREQGVLTILFNNGSQREITYQVHVENGEVYWSEYYFNGELYGKK
jgi:hypothetical protein